MNNYSIIESLKGYYRDRHITMKAMNGCYRLQESMFDPIKKM